MTKPEFRIFPTAEATAKAVAVHIAAALKARPALRLGLATGNTFVPIYAELVALFRAGGFSFAQAESFNLDEYIGLSDGHVASFGAYMRRHLFSLVDLPADKGHLPPVEDNIEQGCRDYEAAIAAAGGIDLQVLGIGRNGHIGFNEPGSAFDSRTRVVELTPSTLAANDGDFPPDENVPPTAATMGIGTILGAREILLVANGVNKAEALKAAFCAPQSLDCPASALQSHPSVVVFCDTEASRYIQE